VSTAHAVEPAWDEVVDVLCVGTGPGALAYAICEVEHDADVLLIGGAEHDDPQTSEYLGAMTEDLRSDRPADLDLPIVRAEPVVAARGGRRDRIEPFIGSRLRDFSAECVTSVFGVLHTESDPAGAAVRTEAGDLLNATEFGRFRPGSDRPGPALVDWLDARAGELGIERDPAMALQRMVFGAGRVAGAAVRGPSGTRLVSATRGVVLATKAVPADAGWPVRPELRDTSFGIAIVRHTASRFGRVMLVAPADSA